MAHPAVHLAVTTGFLTFFLWKRKEEIEKKPERISENERVMTWRDSSIIAAIITFGIFIDIDYLCPMIGPKIFAWGAGGVQGNVSWEICSLKIIPNFAFRWLHSWQAFAGAAIISLFLKSQLPFWSFGVHMLLDGLLNGGTGLIALIHKPIIFDLYMFLKSLGWL